MKNILSKLIEKWLCKHKWKVFRETRIYSRTHNDITGYEYILICKKCGKIKRIKS